MTRVITALLLVPVISLLVLFAPGSVVRPALALAALLCLREFFRLSRQRGFEPFEALGYLAGTVLVVVPHLPQPAFFVVVCFVLLVVAMQPGHPINAVYGAVASTLFALVYICGPFALAGELHAVSPHWLFLVFLLAWVGDSAAYFVGRAIGRHKLAPSISPGKTWEGTAASAVFAVTAGVIYLLHFQPGHVDAVTAFAISLTVNAAGQLGDLAESALKRSAHMKDSGTLLPGHGGMLDRMDHFLFASAAAYLWVMWLG